MSTLCIMIVMIEQGFDISQTGLNLTNYCVRGGWRCVSTVVGFNPHQPDWILEYCLYQNSKTEQPDFVHLFEGVVGSNPAGGEIVPEPKRRFIAQSLSCSPFHCLEMTEILLKGRKTLTHPSILIEGGTPRETALLSASRTTFSAFQPEIP